jgi:hypothetical protein
VSSYLSTVPGIQAVRRRKSRPGATADQLMKRPLEIAGARPSNVDVPSRRRALLREYVAPVGRDARSSLPAAFERGRVAWPFRSRTGTFSGTVDFSTCAQKTIVHWRSWVSRSRTPRALHGFSLALVGAVVSPAYPEIVNPALTGVPCFVPLVGVATSV